MKRFIIFFALILAGCNASGSLGTQQNTVSAVEYGCASAAAALKVINANFARLNNATVANVAKAKAITDPICLQPMVPTLTTTAQAGFTAAVTQLADAAK